MTDAKKHVIVILAMAVSLMLAPRPAPAETSHSADLELSKARAQELLARGQAGEAYDAYMGLLRAWPADDAVCLGAAQAAARAGRLNQAVALYETLIERHPREPGLFAALAQVYMRLGDREAAGRSLAMVRALDGDVGLEQTDRALEAMEARYANLQFHGRIRAGALYDSNANLGPASEVLDLGSWRVTVPGARGKGTFGAYLGADLDLAWRAYRDSPWWLVGDVGTFWRGNEESALAAAHGRELQWGRAALGARHLGPSTLAEARLKAEAIDYELFQRVASYGLEGTFLWAARPTFHLLLKGALDKRDYSRDSPRNGGYGWLGAYGRLFFGADNHELMVGGRYLGARAKRDDYGYDGLEATARLAVKLPHGLEAVPFAGFTRQSFRGPATILEREDRRDDRWRLGLNLTYRIDEAWSVEAGYQRSDNDSSSALYEYGQDYANLGVAWSF
ncbi:MAG: tetratricopeptide repeat protein [Deltaproteobacteria bacterium]|jgi:tetratricopeptide (TPR) repeat protein|nr:tetratricopeptide repeat protein [Deltaproteobacteria bacterium]